jgi:hypothetical protein
VAPGPVPPGGFSSPAGLARFAPKQGKRPRTGFPFRETDIRPARLLGTNLEYPDGAMKFFVYLPAASEKGNLLLDGLRGLPPGNEVEVFDSREDLLRRLRQPKDLRLIVLLFDPSHEDLDDFRSVRHVLVDIPLLLVLSDQDVVTMALAHRLLPSYISYIDSDLAQLFSVIRKLAPAAQEAHKS